MPKTIEAVYRKGKIELSETPSDVCEGTRVLVNSTNLGKGKIANEGSNFYSKYLARG